MIKHWLPKSANIFLHTLWILPVSLILTELILKRIDPLGFHYFSDVNRYEDTYLERPHEDYYIHHPETSFTEKGIEYSFNAEGFRDDDFEMEKPEGVIRVLCIGDSMVYGWGVERSSIFTELLEKMARSEGFPCEIVNAGACSWDTVTESSFLRHRGYKYNPDILLFLIISNDLTKNSHVRPQKPQEVQFSSLFQNDGKFSWELFTRIMLLNPRLFGVMFHEYLKQNVYLYISARYFYLAHKFKTGQVDNYDIDCDNARIALQEMVSLCVNQKIRPLFIVGTSDEDNPSGFQKFYRDFYSSELEKLGVKPKLCQAVFRSRSLRMSVVDAHPTVLGHERIAQAMYPELRSLLLEMTQSEPEPQSSSAEIQQNQRDSVSVSRAADSEKAKAGRP